MGGAKLGGFLSGNEIEMPMCSYQLDYYCDCFEGENGNPEKKNLFSLPWQSAKKEEHKEKELAFVVLLNNLHKCAGETFEGLTTGKANRVG